MELTKTKYEQTEIGLIPSDWEVKCLGDLGQFLKGKGIKKDEVVPDGIPCVRYGELYTVYSNKIERTVSFINEFTSKESIQLRYGDLLFAGSGETKEEIGKSAVILRNDTYAGGDIVIFRTKEIDFQFLGYLSNFTPIQKQKSLYGQGDAVVHIYSGGLSKVKIPLPPTLTEQKAIASALSDVDALISNLDKLISKKKDIKKGAMQQLLTPPNQGGKRLTGLSEEWEEIRLGDIADFLKGKGLPKSELVEEGKNKCIHYGELFTTYSEVIVNISSSTNSYSNIFLSVNNDVLMPTSDVTPNGLATASAIFKDDIILGGDILVIRTNPKVLNGAFLAYQVSVNKPQIMSLVSGTTVYHLYGSDMAEFVFYAPKTDEQDAIVEILEDMNKDIKSLEKTRQKYSNLKQGMMQELLTGKTRLI